MIRSIPSFFTEEPHSSQLIAEDQLYKTPTATVCEITPVSAYQDNPTVVCHQHYIPIDVNYRVRYIKCRQCRV